MQTARQNVPGPAVRPDLPHLGGLTLRRVCAWCGHVESEGDPGAPTTHSICPTCEGRYLSDAAIDAALAGRAA